MNDVAIKEGIPNGWVETTIGDICTIVTGKLDVNQADEGGKYPFFTCAKEIYTINDYAFDAEAILVAGNGFFNVKYYRGKFNAYQRTYVLHNIRVDAKFLYYLVDHRLKKITSGKRGSTIQYIRLGDIRDHPVRIAPLEQQKRIVAKIEELFSHIDAGIASLQAAKKLLKQYRQSVLKAAVTGELTKDWRKANKDKLEPASQLLERILKERRQRWEEQQLEQFKAKGKLPKDDKWKEKYKEPEAYSGDGYNITHEWVMARAEQVCDFITKGTTPSKDKLTSGSGDVPFIKVYNLTFDVRLNFDLNPTYTDVETHEIFLARSKVYPGDVLMNIVGPPLGKVSIVSNIYDEWNINQAIAVYRPLNGLNNKLLAYYLLSKPVVGWMQGKTKTTAGQVNLTLEISRNAPLPIPPEKEQLEMVRLIEEKLTSSDRLISQLEMQVIKAEKNKQTILASAFSGNLN